MKTINFCMVNTRSASSLHTTVSTLTNIKSIKSGGQVVLLCVEQRRLSRRECVGSQETRSG